jgi:hypothetical protein
MAEGAKHLIDRSIQNQLLAYKFKLNEGAPRNFDMEQAQSISDAVPRGYEHLQGTQQPAHMGSQSATPEKED